jgi:phosphonate transport system substrate-binding protein
VNTSSIRFANYLSPALQETYQYIATAVSERLGRQTSLRIGRSPEELQNGEADAGFLCGLLYTHTTRWPDAPIEVLAAPILQGAYYKQFPGKPLYFSDVIARRESPYQTFADLAGRIWAYNEPGSHSGYNLVYHSLLERGLTFSYFGETRQSGSHAESLRMVLEGRADAAAIDAQVLTTVLRADPRVAAKLRIIDMLGPSSSPPVVVARSLDAGLKREIQAVLVTLHKDPVAVEELRKGAIERFVPVVDEDYDDIRAMWQRVQTHLSENLHTTKC